MQFSKSSWIVLCRRCSRSRKLKAEGLKQTSTPQPETEGQLSYSEAVAGGSQSDKLAGNGKLAENGKLAGNGKLLGNDKLAGNGKLAGYDKFTRNGKLAGYGKLAANGNFLAKTVWLSEDATRITEKVQYDASTDTIVGLITPLVLYTGFPQKCHFSAASLQDILHAFENEPSNVNVVMVRSMDAAGIGFCLTVHSVGESTVDDIEAR
ncbi:hypothetical protein DMENIID0001_043450 [Sergentomyia squamirostris]